MKITQRILSFILALALLTGIIPASSLTTFATSLNRADTFRITLTWNASPNDLDSHLEGEDSSGDAFHVYYQNKNVYDSDNTLLASLDVDDTTGYGPENTTIFKSIPNKTFRFYVYNYSGERPINGCGAIVKLYKNDVLIGQYMPPANSGDGRYWNLFQILNGDVYVVNSIANTSLSSGKSININANDLTENNVVITPKIAADDAADLSFTASNVRMKKSTEDAYEEQINGSFVIEDSRSANYSVTLFKEDYRNYIIPQEVLESWGKIDLGSLRLDTDSAPSIFHSSFLKKDRKDGKPYISTVFCHKGSLMQNDLKNAFVEVQHESININQDERYTLILSAAGLNGKHGTFYIAQDQERKISSDTGVFRSVDLFTLLDFQKTTYAYLVTEDGVVSELMPLHLVKTPETASDKLVDALKSGSISLLGKQTASIKVPSSVPLFGDAEISMDAFKFPAGFELSDNTLKISIGANIFNRNKELEKDSPTKYKEWVNTYFKDWKESIKQITKSNDKDKNKKAAKSFKEKWGLGEKYKNKEKNWNVDFLGYIELELVDGDWVTREAAISLEGSFSFEYTVQGAIWVVPTYFSLEAGCALGATGVLSRVIADSSIPFEFDLTLKLAPELELGAGIGYKKAVSAGLYAEAKLPITFEIRKRHFLMKAQGEIGVEAKLFVFGGKKKLLDGTLNILDKYFGTSSSTQVSSTPATNSKGESKPEYYLQSRDYLENTSGWLSSAPKLYARRLLQANGLTLTNLQTSVYDNAMPRVVSFGDKMLMTWVEDSADRNAYNRMRLMYSVYNGIVWSEPQPVSDDGYNDSTPVIVTDGTDVYFAWQKLCATLSEDNLENVSDITNYVEIFTAKYDVQSNSICNVRQETSNNNYDYLHHIAIVDGNATLFYVSNHDAATLRNNTICQSDLSGNVTVIAEGLNYIVDMAASESGISYLVDLDGDTLTTSDLNIYTYNPATAELVDETAKLLEIQSTSSQVFITDIFYADFCGKTTLFAVSGREIYHINADGIGSLYVPDTSISGDVNYIIKDGTPVLYWTAAAECGNAVYASLYQNDAWTEPVAVSETNTILTGVTIVNYNDSVKGVCTSTELVYDEESENYTVGQTNLCAFDIADKYDVEVDFIQIEEENIHIGETATFCVYVKNGGSTLLESLDITVSDGLGYNQSTQLAVNLLPGEAAFFDLAYVVPENYGRTTLTVTAAPYAYETNIANNTVSKEIGLPKIVISDATVYRTKNSYLVSAFVTNESDIVATEDIEIIAKLDENVIHSATVLENILPRQSCYVDFEILATEIPFVDSSATVFLTSERENVLGNTTTVLIVKNETQCLHPVTYETVVDSTCVIDGLRTILCAGCQSIVEEQPIAATGHHFDLADTCSVCTAQRINESEVKQITLPADQSIVSFVFTPDSEEEYCLFSDMPCSIVARIVDERTSEIYSQQFALDGTLLKLNYTFQSGIPYVLQFANASGIETTLPITIEKLTPATDIVFADTAVSGYRNTTQQLEVSFLPTNAIVETLEWTSNNPECVEVDSSGIVYLREVGSSTITVTSENGLTASIEVTVKDFPEILLDETKSAEITEAGQNVTYRFTPETDGTYVFYAMSSADTYGYILDSNGNVLTADDDGGDGGNFRVEYALTGGQTYLLQARFYSSSITGSFDVKLEKRLAAEAISITQGAYLEKYVNEDFFLNYTFAPVDCVAESVTWTSSDETVATVNANGQVTLLTPGTVQITVTSENGLTDTCTIAVSDYPTILAGQQQTVEVTDMHVRSRFYFTPETDGVYAFYSISQADTYGSILSRDGNYLVSDDQSGDNGNFRIEYALTAGHTYILESCFWNNSERGSFDIIVEKLPAAESITLLQGDHLENYINEHIYLSYAFAPANCIQESVIWSSSDETVATVNANGQVTLLTPGTVQITVTSENGLTDTCTITVSDYPTILAGQQQTVEVTDMHVRSRFYFTPETDGVYAFYSISQADTYGSILSRDGNYLVSDDQSGDNGNFRIEYALTAGQTYILESYFWNISERGTFDVKVVEIVDAQEIQITAGDTYSAQRCSGHQLSVAFLPDGARDENISWTSSDSSIVSVDSYGYIYLNRLGSAVITATSENGLTDSITVEVTDFPAIELDREVIVSDGTAIFSFVPAVTGTYFFYSYDNDFDTVGLLYDADMNPLQHNDDGGDGSNFHIQHKLIAGQKYYFESRPYSSGRTGTYAVQLNMQPVAGSMRIDNGDTLSAYIGDQVYLSVTFAPDGCCLEDVTWVSDNESVVTVNADGQVTLLAQGTAIVTATSENGLTDSVVVTVKDYPSITLDAGVTVELNEEHRYEDLRFTPEEDGCYVFYSDCNLDTYGYIMDADKNVLASNDDGDNGYNFRVSHFLYAGETYIMRAQFYDTSDAGSFDVFLEKTAHIAKLEILSLPDKLEYVKGFANSIDYSGLQLRATWSDGRVEDWSPENGSYIGDYEVIRRVNYDTGEIKISCGGQEISFFITLIDNPVDHLELVSGTSKVYIENYQGYYRFNEEGEYFHYYTETPNDAVIRVVYTDGTTATANVGEYFDGYWVSWTTYQYDTPWVVGSENESTVTYLGHTVNLPITVIENPVERIEIVSGKVTCVEGIDGYVDEDGTFYYDYAVPSDITVKVYYTDGTSKTANIRDSLDGYWFDWYDEQEDVPWTVGDDNHMYVEYLDVIGEIPVTILPSPLDHIEINTAPTREYVYGDHQFGYMDDDVYDFYPDDLTGLSFTAYYTDGTQKTFTDADISGYRIDGYYCDLLYDGYDPELGEFPVTFCYMGKQAEYTVTLKESPLESMSISRMPTVTEYGVSFDPTFYGTEFLLTFKDGSTKTVVLNEENLRFDYDWENGLSFYADVDGNRLTIDKAYGYDVGASYCANYMDQWVEFSGFTYTDEDDITDVTVNNADFDAGSIDLTITYQDNHTETLHLDLFAWIDYGDGMDCYAQTEKGLLYFYVDYEWNHNDVITEYIFHFFGYRIHVEANAPCATLTIGDQVTEYTTVQEALENWQDGALITLLTDVEDDVEISDTVVLDLNGCAILGNVSVVSEETLYILDSRTDDYSVMDDWGYGVIYSDAANIQPADGYVKITEDGETSFHKFDASVKEATLRARNAGIYYTGEYLCDEVVARNVEAWGVSLSVANPMPTADGSDVTSMFTQDANSVLLKDILSIERTDDLNRAYADIPVYSRAYLKLTDGTFTYGYAAGITLHELVETAANELWSGLSPEQKDSLTALYRTYSSVMNDWAIENIKNYAGA